MFLIDNSSFWGEYDALLALDGIFVDETPTQYSLEHISYLRNVSQTVQNSVGLKDNYIGKKVLFISGLSSPYFGEMSAAIAPLLWLAATLWLATSVRGSPIAVIRPNDACRGFGSCLHARLTVHYSP